jgi:acyl dehydratase
VRDVPASTLLRAALPSIPIVNQLPGIRKSGREATLHALGTVTVDHDRVAAYARVCGFPVKDTAPLTFPHVLAFPLHMALMTSPDFPFPAIGTIHLANSITQHRPISLGEELTVEVHTEGPRAHPRGRTVDFLAAVRSDGDTVWESTSTYLRRGRSDVVSTSSTDDQRSTDDERPTDDLDVVPGRVSWRLGGDVGRRYAAVSGDRNPIHLYSLTAKALGFPRQIAHGMWSLARCVAALENRLPDAVTVDAAFKKPILLPGTVAFGQDPTEDGIAFALTAPTSGAPHVVGRTRARP